MRFVLFTLAILLITGCSSGNEPTPTAKPDPEIPVVEPEFVPAGTGGVRPFPSSLLPSSSPLPDQEVSKLWREFLSDTLVIYEDPEGPLFATSFCTTGTGTIHLHRVIPQIAGEPLSWNISSDSDSPWYSAAFAASFAAGEHALLPPVDGALPMWVKNEETALVIKVVVRDYPACEARTPLKFVHPDVTELLGIGVVREFPEGLTGTSMTEEERLRVWYEYLTGSISWHGGTGRPMTIQCVDGVGVQLGPGYPENREGEPFTWFLEIDDSYPNAVHIVQEFEDETFRGRVLHPDIVTPVFEADVDDCSAANGLRIAAEFED